MNKRKRGLVMGDDGEVLSEILSVPEKPKRSIGSGLRRAGWRVIAVLLILAVGILIGVNGYGHYQTASMPTSATKPVVGILSTPTASPESTPTGVPSGASHILWVSNCDPRTDSRHCNQGKIEILTEFYATIHNLGADIVYALPKSSTDLLPYDVVVLDYCDFAASALPAQLFRDYVWGGGSLIVMGDNFCVGVHAANKLGSSAEAATLLTTSWGIRFTGDDDANNPEITTFADDPLTAGVK